MHGHIVIRSNAGKKLYGRISDPFVIGLVYFFPIVNAHSNVSFAFLTSPSSLPIYFIVIVLSLFTNAWFRRFESPLDHVGKSGEDLFHFLAETMIVPVLFFCGQLFLFGEPVADIIYFGSVTYLASLPVLFVKKYYRWCCLPPSSH